VTRRYGAPAPDGVRHLVRAGQHPARAVECPHCGAHEHQPCTTPSKRRRLGQPHPGRITAWAIATAVCPTCQVEPGIHCHQDGWPLAGAAAHPARHEIAGEAVA
jgi:Zn ribbon nucleic-acid-binding protein